MTVVFNAAMCYEMFFIHEVHRGRNIFLDYPKPHDQTKMGIADLVVQAAVD